MNSVTALEMIKSKFEVTGSPVKIPLQNSKSFTATIITEGIEVDNLGNQSFLPWKVFEETINLLVMNGGKAERGDARKGKLGDEDLPLNSVEGHIASVVYEKEIGKSILARISPVAGILIWAKICEHTPGELVLL